MPRHSALIAESAATVVAAIVHRGADVLLVREQGPGDDSPRWSLPGGRVEAGESLHDALRREVREETGIEVDSVGRLVNLSSIVIADKAYTCAVYAVDGWQGDLAPADPDGLIKEARFLSPADAIDRVAQRPETSRKEPVSAYLRGEIGAAESWVYRRLEDGSDEFVLREVLA